MDGSDDGAMSEITILPDGRVYLFGLTLPLLEILADLPTREGQWKAMLTHYHAAAAGTCQKESSCE